MSRQNIKSVERYHAPWGWMLQLSTTLWLLGFVGISFWSYQLLPTPLRYSLPGLFALYTLWSWAFRVKAYQINGPVLEIVRPLWTTRINAKSLRKIRMDASSMQGALPLFANPGLFSFNGWFHTEKHGIVRAFVTDRKSVIRIQLSNDPRLYMISPEHPEHFLKTLRNNTRS